MDRLVCCRGVVHMSILARALGSTASFERPSEADFAVAVLGNTVGVSASKVSHLVEVGVLEALEGTRVGARVHLSRGLVLGGGGRGRRWWVEAV